MIILQDNRNRAAAVKTVFYIMMGMNIVSAWSNLMQYQLLKTAQERMALSPEVAGQNDLRQRIIGIISILCLVATIVIFIMWYYRAYKNLHALKINRLHYTPGWAIGGWFVPILNLSRPYEIMKEIWNETQRFYLPDGENSSSVSIIGWWWTFWLSDNILSNISSRITMAAGTIPQYMFSSMFSVISDTAGIIAMIITLIMVNRMSEYELLLKDHAGRLNNALPDEKPADEIIPASPAL